MTPATEKIKCKIDGDKFTIGTSTREIEFKLNWAIAMMMIGEIRVLIVPPHIQNEGLYEDVDGQRLTMEFAMTSNDYWAMDMHYGSDQLYTELTHADLEIIAREIHSYLNS